MNAIFKLVDLGDFFESPTIEKIFATGRARCRFCGEKIAKGDLSFLFYASFTDGSYNPWTSIACQAHVSCVEAANGAPLTRGFYDLTKKGA